MSDNEPDKDPPEERGGEKPGGPDDRATPFDSSWAERTQRTMDFILQQQAQFVVNQQRAEERMAKAEERMARAEERMAKMEERWGRTEESIRALLATAEIQAEEIRAQGEQIRNLTEAVKVVDERSRNTDERLNALIAVVERYVSERGNGRRD